MVVQAILVQQFFVILLTSLITVLLMLTNLNKGKVFMNKKAIVTGANGKLGTAFVEALTGKGYFVYAVDLNIENIEASESVELVKLDITYETAVHNFFSSVQDFLGASNRMLKHEGGLGFHLFNLDS